MKKNLVIVESPAKAKTLGRILGKGYNLKASMGHIRDLPKGAIGVNIENGFAPKYVVPRTKSKLVKELKEAAKTAAAVYLATDPDREGEAIAWHLFEVTRSDRKPYHRVVFHEITEEAIEHAFKQPRSIDLDLVNAQQARRIMDRLVGYKISPLLWKKVRRGLSAGRVQSVALRIIVEREREIDKFTPQEYWTIDVELATEIPADATVRASLVGLGDGTRLEIHNREEADCICDELREARYRVGGIRTKKVSRRPAPPFITSTLQQEAWRRFRFSAKQTMSIAQQLYEGLAVGNEGSVGLITYMRTDSTRVARSAVVEAREFINSRYGPKFVPAHARSFT
ncbi:MAG: DNA topoisomerase, partial [Dehalococcoidales bacterium]|nr:DNA topoisomerase [Dehalococcoidales bacterium]